MKRNKKTLLAIGLILLVVVLGVASIFVSARLSSQKSVSPNAPTSKPKASGALCPGAQACPGSDGVLRSCTPGEADGTATESICNTNHKGKIAVCDNEKFCCPTTGTLIWTTDLTKCPTATIPECGNCTAAVSCDTGLSCDSVDGKCKKTDGTSVCFSGSTACTTEFTIAGCTSTSVITCSPDCPTACGTAASTISTCKNSCNTAVTKSCAATAACGAPDISFTKEVYQDEPANTAGHYELTTEINTVSKDQTFVYVLSFKNVGDATANNVTISDTLTGQKQDLLTFVDADGGCSYSTTDKKITCSNITIDQDKGSQKAFRVKVSNTAVNGDVIKNLGKLSYGTTSKTATKDLIVSTVLGCNHTCTSNTECTGSLVCDTSSNKCRSSACLTASSCTCPTATVAPTIALAKCNRACDTDSDCIAGLICDSATSMCRKEACTSKTNCVCSVATATQAPRITLEPTESNTAAEPTILPETGILDFPGVAAFGGGLLMAVIGILLAL